VPKRDPAGGGRSLRVVNVLEHERKDSCSCSSSSSPA